MNSAWGHQPVPSPALSYGERIRVSAKLHRPRNFRNPGAFDYEGYLRENSISLLGSASMDDVERMPGFLGSRVALWRARVHASIISKIHQLWPASQATLMDAMVLGEESFLSNATRAEFQRSGTYHLLVVSGMNLSILAFAIFWALRKTATRSGAGRSRHCCRVIHLCVRRWSGPARLARRADARNLSRGALAIPRPQHAECHRGGSDWRAHCRSARFIRRQFSADISWRCSSSPPSAAPLLERSTDPLFPRAAVARGDQLRSSCRAERRSCGWISGWSADAYHGSSEGFLAEWLPRCLRES